MPIIVKTIAPATITTDMPGSHSAAKLRQNALKFLDLHRTGSSRYSIGIAAMLAAGRIYSQVQAATGCSRATIAKIVKRVSEAA